MPAVKKVTVVGAGNVGSNAARRIAELDVAREVVMIDIVEGRPQGLALDINQSAPVVGFRTQVVGTNDYADTSGSEVVVITAGLPRGPGMSRMDLLDANSKIVAGVAAEIAQTSPNAVVIVVSNPLDEMTFLAAVVSGFPRTRVMGMAGVLDSARLSFFVADALGVPPSAVEAMTLGSHGEQMLALPRLAKAEGRPLPELLDETTLESLVERTREAGAEIVGHLKSGSAFYAPAASAARMVEAIAKDSSEVMPVCAWTTGEFGIADVYLGLPARLGARGVTEIVELDLAPTELKALQEAGAAIRARCDELTSRFPLPNDG